MIKNYIDKFIEANPNLKETPEKIKHVSNMNDMDKWFAIGRTTDTGLETNFVGVREYYLKQIENEQIGLKLVLEKHLSREGVVGFLFLDFFGM